MGQAKADTRVEDLLIGIAIITTFVVEPFAIAAMWTWFVVPLGFPAIAWAQACGLNLLIAVVRFRYTPTLPKDEQVTRAWSNVGAMLFGWGLAWLVVRLSN